jgi:hypothetical protein
MTAEEGAWEPRAGRYRAEDALYGDGCDCSASHVGLTGGEMQG